MNRWSAAALAAMLLALAPATACPAQQDASSAASAPAQVSPGANSPALPQAPQKPKKVWTNDDLAGPPESPASSSGDSKTNAGRNVPGHDSSNSLVRSYRAQIAALQRQVADLDKQIADLKAALSGKTVDEPRKYNPSGGRIGDWAAQLEQLERKRWSLAGQIEGLEKQIRQVRP